MGKKGKSKFTSLAILVAVVISIVLYVVYNRIQEDRILQQNLRDWQALVGNKSTNEDEVFIQYKDSLKKYFGPLETALIKQYKKNHETIASEEDFYRFYRNAATLKLSLNKKFKKKAKIFIKENKPLPDLSWFAKVTAGMDISKIHNGTSYEVFFDYQDFHEHSHLSEGVADDDFVELLELCYSDHVVYPNWVSPTENYQVCTKVGSGKHIEILRTAYNGLKKSKLFKSEVTKIKRDIINDLLYRKKFCRSSKEVISEIKNITSSTFVTDREKELLFTAIDKISKGEGYAFGLK